MRKAKFYIETYGCSTNKGNSEYIMGQLLDKGYRLTKRIEDADVLIVNTCGVKKPTEDKILFRLRELSSQGKPLVIVGCLTRINPEALKKVAKEFSVLLDSHSIEKIRESMEKALKGVKGEIYLSEKPLKGKLRLPRHRFSIYTEIIQICEGCIHNCTYCAEKKAHPFIYSYPKEGIIKRAEEALKEGVKEIWLTALDTGVYGIDKGYTLIDLLNEITSLHYKFKVRLGMMNPFHAKKHLEELLEVYKSMKMYKFIHLPVQSGSNKVLEEMDRRYLKEDFVHVIKKFKERVPEVTIATDVIVGYPSETDEDFEETLNLVKEVKPDKVNISKFFPRPGSKAWGMKILPPCKVKERSKLLHETCRAIALENNKKLVNKVTEALILEKADGGVKGRLLNYKPVFIPLRIQTGVFIKVKIINAKEGSLVALPNQRETGIESLCQR